MAAKRLVCAPCHPALAHRNDGPSLPSPRLGAVSIEARQRELAGQLLLFPDFVN